MIDPYLEEEMAKAGFKLRTMRVAIADKLAQTVPSIMPIIMKRLGNFPMGRSTKTIRNSHGETIQMVCLVSADYAIFGLESEIPPNQ